MRYLLPIICFAGSLICYSMGVQSGFIVLLICGLALEIGFWTGLLRLFSRANSRE